MSFFSISLSLSAASRIGGKKLLFLGFSFVSFSRSTQDDRMSKEGRKVFGLRKMPGFRVLRIYLRDGLIGRLRCGISQDFPDHFRAGQSEKSPEDFSTFSDIYLSDPISPRA